MAYSPIAFIAPNYSDYGTYWLKAYLPGSTTPKLLAIELTAATTFAKLQLNVDGFFKSAGGALITPYVEGAYDAYLFQTEAEADANNTAGAIRLADNITPLADAQLRTDLAAGTVDVNLDNDLSQAYVFDTVAAYKAFANAFPVGKLVQLKDRGAQFTVIAGAGSATTYNIIANNTAAQSIELIDNGVVHTRAYGVPTDGTDASPALISAVAFTRAGGTPYKNLVVDKGVYSLANGFAIENVIDYKVHFDNPIFTSIATTPKDVMLLCSSWAQCALTGKARFNNTTNAATAMFKSGFSLQAGSTGTTKNSFSDMTYTYFEEGLVVGDKAQDLICSENTFYNTNFFECTTALHGGGSQTGATFVGGNLLATPHVNLPGKKINAMLLEGGFWALNGTEVLTTQSASDQCILMRPHEFTNVLYAAQYPQLRIVGGIMETASSFIFAENPNGETINPNGQGGQVSLSGIGGYSGGAAVVNSVFINTPADYRGKIQVRGCNFYTGDARNAFNISVGDNCQVEVDKTSFGAGFRNWIGGINGGILSHSEEVITGAKGSAGATYVNGVNQTVKFANQFNQARFTRYNPAFNLATGIFTVPAGGLSSLTVLASIVVSGYTGSLTIQVNNVESAFGVDNGFASTVNSTFSGLSAGDTVAVFYKPSGANKTLVAGDFNNITFTASND
jgi:hypothetical protein